jgi:hypothetical protein
MHTSGARAAFVYSAYSRSLFCMRAMVLSGYSGAAVLRVLGTCGVAQGEGSAALSSATRRGLHRRPGASDGTREYPAGGRGSPGTAGYSQSFEYAQDLLPPVRRRARARRRVGPRAARLGPAGAHALARVRAGQRVGTQSTHSDALPAGLGCAGGGKRARESTRSTLRAGPLVVCTVSALWGWPGRVLGIGLCCRVFGAGPRRRVLGVGPRRRVLGVGLCCRVLGVGLRRQVADLRVGRQPKSPQRCLVTQMSVR